MNLTYKNNKLYMFVSPQERTQFIPFIYGAKLDMQSGLWVAPVGTLLPIMVIFPVIKPTDSKTAKLLNDAKNIIVNVKNQKELIKNHSTVTNETFPFLMSHQAICNNIAKVRPRYALFLDTGTRQNYISFVYYVRYNK